ncbi:flagellar protein FlbD [Acetoanaerobium noterae]|jgi:flagellar protein FlbD|uniref:Flagellar protein FlbD n=1 Tax=Acetoanaerobium noterae TaxID=745369 RepID=A0A1T4ZVY5_9FIRM|nr:flagellar FlbD family protein [Acetoanaerobium noterae]SKB26868.1 flagellar protein FlbD [Acetoanaerobium noterae]
MIKVSRLNGEEYVLNSSLIETVEANPDTVISLTTGHKLVVRESVDEIIEKVIKYSARVNAAIKVIQSEV